MKTVNWIRSVMLGLAAITAIGSPTALAAQQSIVLGMGCFWGAEKRMQSLAGVTEVEAGYAGGDFANPSYQQIHQVEQKIAAGMPRVNHAEVVKVTFDPAKVSLEQVLAQFWQSHNPTQINRQGNDVGSNYRSAIFYSTKSQQALAEKTKRVYQSNLRAQGIKARITTQISPLTNYTPAETYHQNYLAKNPQGYCGLGGLGVTYQDGHSTTQPSTLPLKPAASAKDPWAGVTLNSQMQLIAFEAAECGFCKQFNKEVAANWQASTPLARTYATTAPKGWTLDQAVFATPTLVLFKHKKEVARMTGYSSATKFWAWYGAFVASDQQKKIAFNKGTEAPYTSNLLDEKRSGVFVDALSGAPLFISGAKFNSGTGWPSFFDPIKGSVILKDDLSLGVKRTEVISASSGIHLGHVFYDGPPPTGLRFCINGDVLKFVPDALQKPKQ